MTLKEWSNQLASCIYLNLCYKVKSRRKLKFAWLVFLLFPNLILFIKSLWIMPSKGHFSPCCLLYLHQPWNGSCRQLDKWIEKLLLPAWNKQNPNIHKTFCFRNAKTSTISLWAALKNDVPVSLTVYRVFSSSCAQSRSSLLRRGQDSACSSGSRGSWAMMGERETVLGRLSKYWLRLWNAWGKSAKMSEVGSCFHHVRPLDWPGNKPGLHLLWCVGKGKRSSPMCEGTKC